MYTNLSQKYILFFVVIYEILQDGTDPWFMQNARIVITWILHVQETYLPLFWSVNHKNFCMEEFLFVFSR